MNPIEFNARALRRIALTTCQDKTHPHLCAMRFRPSDVVATNGTILVRVPLPHDPERDFVLPSMPTVETVSRLHRSARVTLTRGDGEVRISAGLGYSFVISDDPDISVDRYPSVEVVINATQDVGAVADVHISASMWIRVGQLARDLMPDDGAFSSQMIPYAPDDAPVRILKAGCVPAKGGGNPAHIAFATKHGDALAVVMPVRR